MIYSMTGYGTSSSGIGKNKINAELKALNGKFFELKIRGLDINFNLSKTIKDYLFKTLIYVQRFSESTFTEDFNRLEAQ